MQESLFTGTEAGDEYELCSVWGHTAERRLRAHRETYITRDDLVWIAARGLNSVRIPFGYWILDGDPPFIACADMLEQALRWCDELHLMVILDLHGVAGGQSAEHHTGRRNDFRWPDDPHCRSRTLQSVEELAQRFAPFGCIRGFSLVNEPDPSIPAPALRDFYREAYRRIRRYMSHEVVAVIIPAFTEHRLPEFHARMRPPEFENIITDVHYYQCFGDSYAGMSLDDHLDFPLSHRQPELRRAMSRGWIMVGEWSLRLPWYPTDIIRELSETDRDRVLRRFGEDQLQVYGETQGWFFWTYKAEDQPEWSLRHCVAQGWLPSSFA